MQSRDVRYGRKRLTTRDYMAENKDIIIAEYCSNISSIAISKRRGVPYGTILDYLHRWGVAIRPSSGKYVDKRARKVDLKRMVNERKVRCVLCGESNKAVLLFHHIDPSAKLSSVSVMVNNRLSLEYIIAEIAKCAIICFNCHRIVHLKEVADIFDDYKEATC